MKTLLSLLAAGFVAAVMLTGATTMLGTTAASFTDGVDATATVAAQSLPAPAGVAATLDDGDVTVTWQSTAGDFAGDFEVYRHAGACASWTPSGPPLATVDGGEAPESYAYVDNSELGDGQTYCYAVRGLYESWVSPFGAISSAAEVTSPVPSPADPSRLYLHGGSADTLQTSAGAGSTQFGDGVIRVYQSSSMVAVSEVEGWTASLRITGRNPNAANLDGIDVVAWYASGACGTAVSASSEGRVIATGTSGSLAGPGDSLPATLTVSLTPASGYVTPGGDRTVCMQVTAHVTHNNSGRYYELGYGTDTWLEGPVAP